MNKVVFIGLILPCFWVYTAGAGSFFYTVPAFPQIQPQFYQAPLLINQGYQYTTPGTFFSRQLTPATTFYSSHQAFGTTEFGSSQKSPSSSTSSSPAQNNNFPAVDARTQFIPGPSDQFRGFAYHTTYDNGASSNVIFVTGPEARQIKNLEPFANNFTSSKARTLASDITDSNAVQDENGEIQSALTNQRVPDLLAFFRNPQVAVQNFYSRNSRLFSDGSSNNQYPANTVPLDNPTPIAEFNNAFFQSSQSTDNATENPITTTEQQKIENNTTEKEADVAESMIENTRVPANALSNMFLKLENQEITSSTTTARSTTAASLPVSQAANSELPTVASEIVENTTTITTTSNAIESTTTTNTSLESGTSDTTVSSN